MKKVLSVFVVSAILFLGTAGNSFADNYWKNWTPGKAKGPMPTCDVNVLALGGDDILQATVETYCAMSPGNYESFINPKVMKIYNSQGDTYPDGKTAVLVFTKIGAYFSTDHKDGKPIYDVKTIAEDKSIASSEEDNPLNPATCATCHITFDGACSKRGFICGTRLE